ncbi:TraG/TraD/VirD4 family protein, partial [Streptomyces sp. ADMS]
RLDPPALCVLDEAANVCKISDLPDLYSHLGSRGVIPMTILQSYRQGQRCWGEAGMDALWSAATIKIIGSGIDDADFADRLSRQVGDHDVQTTSVSTSDGGKSTSVS